ncbi:hypothetical protein [Bdellovibrio sp. HCB274]|uniref:hypothetical protein n=1 Tax=Bdellovibrio sp. HCB274 TaxID=3394361 RepID=UPI0039B67C3F
MKSLLIAMSMLIAGTASASVTSIKVCDPANGADAAVIVVKGDTLTISSSKGKNSVKIREVMENTSKDLREMESFFNLERSLVEATTYVTDDSGLVLAVDQDGVQHLLTAIGVGGNSKSCK